MIETIIQKQPGQIYRIDKFKLPQSARDEFMQKVQIDRKILIVLQELDSWI